MLNESENAVSLRRSISWSSALRDMRSHRQPAAERRVYLATVHAAKIEAMRAENGTKSRLWTPAAGFDRRAIMAKAVANARTGRGTWSERMSEALKYAWSCAHAARRAGSH